MDGKEMQNAQNIQVNCEEVNREGFAMVTTLLVVLILSVLAVGAVWMATSEKKTTFAEGVHVASVFAADAGGESGINFIRLSDSPPAVNDFGTMVVRNQGQTALEGRQSYSYDATFINNPPRGKPKPGWGLDYLDFDYRIGSRGTAGQNGDSGVDVVLSRMYRTGY
jgi:Tfp pilus assembly protein PilX